jgi:hypothetical protein
MTKDGLWIEAAVFRSAAAPQWNATREHADYAASVAKAPGNLLAQPPRRNDYMV